VLRRPRLRVESLVFDQARAAGIFGVPVEPRGYLSFSHDVTVANLRLRLGGDSAAFDVLRCASRRSGRRVREGARDVVEPSHRDAPDVHIRSLGEGRGQASK
jgi:hypothetical protein